MKTNPNDGDIFIGYVQDMIEKAITLFASDIHLEPTSQELRVRFRIDGMLFDQPSVIRDAMHQLLSYIKVLASLNIAEKRVPQDGTFRKEYSTKTVDFRVSTFPGQHGEKIVIRILDRSVHTMALEKLGMDAQMCDAFKKLIAQSHGFFLVVGPTGSGKTTTLYAALEYLNTPEKNIITLEDPVEYHVEHITQGQIKPEAGFTFEKGIRSLLRQDPDILMVGEIRDKQTARIALEAALTGHIVLSTVHTNDAPSTVIRLIDMGIEPFLLNACVTGVLAQRLARRICSECKQEGAPTQSEHAILSQLNLVLDSVARGTGCAACLGSGYKGRVGIFELLVMTNDIRSLIVQHPSAGALTVQAIKDGMHCLLDDACDKVRAGLISVQELARILL